MKIQILGFKIEVRRVVVAPIGSRGLTDEQVAAHLAMNEQAPVWKAFMQKLEDHIQDQVMILTQTNTTLKGLADREAGGLETLYNLREDLEAIRSAGVSQAKAD